MDFTFISGATGGIGKAFCYELAKQSKNLFITGRSQEKLNILKAEIVEKYNVNVDCFASDLTDEKSRQSMLDYIQEKGYKIVLATSKPEPFAKLIIERFNLTKYFTYIAGATFDGKIKKKEDVIANALKQLNITTPSEVIMIGDRKHDLIGASINNMDSIGVLYGFGNRQEFIENNATYIVDTVNDLYNKIISF